MVEGGAATDAGDRLTDVPRHPSFIFAAVFLPLVTIFSLTAEWSVPYHIDPLTNAITGWYIGNEGTPIASEHEVLVAPDQHGNGAWFVPAPQGPASQYPPGAALLAALVYAIAPNDDMTVRSYQGSNRPDLAPVEVPLPPLWPATVSSVLATAGACAVLGLIFARLGACAGAAVAGGILSGLATGAWSVASGMSWTHGPAMLAVALALLAAERERWGLCGLAISGAILCRPHLAVVGAAIGLGMSWSRRSSRPAVAVGLTSSIGLGLLMLYNDSVWGTPSVSGGYGDAFSDRFTSSGLGWFVRNVWGALFDIGHGLLPWAPFLLVLLAGALSARNRLPSWTIWSAVGGALYLLIQLRSNRWSGGDGHFGYRYPLEAMVATAPMLYLGYRHWVRERRFRGLLLKVTLAVGLAGQILGAVGGITTTS